MNDRNLDQLLTAWMDLGPSTAPDRVADAARLEARSTRQTAIPPWWPPRRFPSMNNIAKLSVAAAVVAVAALLGFNYLVGPNVGNPNLDGGPERTPTPSPAASPTSYLITNDEGVRVTLTLPDGWTRGGWLVNNGLDNQTELTALQVWAVTGNSYTDPCNWDETALDPPLGPTVDDLATALENQLTREATVSDVTLDGYSGKLVQMTVPADAVFADCDGGEFRSWAGRFHQGPGQQDDVYILDVDGFRLVIDALSFPGSPAADLEELQQMLDTIDIEPPA